MDGVIKIEGSRIYLSPVVVEDYQKYTKWLNDIEINLFLKAVNKVVTYENEREFLINAAKCGEYIFGIRLIEDDKLIGNCGLMNIDNINRKASIGIFIGDKNYHNNGYGTEAIKLLLDYAFYVLNLNNIWLSYYSYNQRARRCYEKCGFKVVGIRRQAKIINGKKYDEVYMDILREEYSGSKFKRKLDEILKCEGEG